MLPRPLTCLGALLLVAALLTSPLAGETKKLAEPPPPTASGTTQQTAANFTKYEALIVAITIFVLAIFVGYEVISKVPTTLHTPLMSGSNAISGIAVVGAIIVGGFAIDRFSSFLGFVAIVLAMINVMGGFLVTHRMLAMFKRR